MNDKQLVLKDKKDDTLIDSLIKGDLDENILNLYNLQAKKREMIRKINFDNLGDEALKLLMNKVLTKPDMLTTQDLTKIVDMAQNNSSKLKQSINDNDNVLTINVKTETENKGSENNLTKSQRDNILEFFNKLKEVANKPEEVIEVEAEVIDSSDESESEEKVDDENGII